jgi:hypothetical protein
MIPQRRYAYSASTVWWVACHGGSGTSTLASLCGLGVDAGRAWPPRAQSHEPTPTVVLVCRATAAGTFAATAAVRQWQQKTKELATSAAVAPDVLGVAAVAASPRRMPRIAAERLQLLAGWVPTVWRIGWIEALLAADEPREVGMPPDVDALRRAVAAAVDTGMGT